jgi:hypothetical protein
LTFTDNGEVLWSSATSADSLAESSDHIIAFFEHP